MLKMFWGRRRTVAAVPTIGIFASYPALRNGRASLDKPFLYEFLHPPHAEQVRARAKRDLSDHEYVASSVKFAATLQRKLRDLISTGVPIAIGTDVGSAVQPHPGAIWREMEAWRSYGVAHQLVLRAATSIPAAILEERDLGRAHCSFPMEGGSVRRDGA